MYKRKGMSKSQIARDVKKQKEIYLKRFLSSENNAERKIEVMLPEENSINNISSLNNSRNNVASHLSLKEKLKKWCIKYNPGRYCVDSLLKILNEENLEVPTCFKSLLNYSDKIIERTVAPGKYWHYGIKNQIKKISDLFNEFDEVIVDINVDGLPLFKSSNLSLWPILGKVVNICNIKVFLIGAYLGSKKPSSIENYLHDFVMEVKDLLQNGLYINNKKVSFKLGAFICDAPAKSFVCGIVGHTSLRGCTKCIQTGTTINKVVVFDTKTSDLISDEDFSERKYLYVHQKYFQTKKTPLEAIGVNMISQIAIDPMHLIDLGVTRKFLTRLLQNKISPCYKISNEIKYSISEHLKSLYSFTPREFARKPRGIDEINNWKAVEYRQFILYTGICILKNKVHEDVYYLFLLLHCAYRLLSCPKSFIANLSTAQELLESFVENFACIFGEDSVTYNVHHLLHLTDNINHLGILTNFSAYCFENKMQILKRLIKRPSKILQQLFNKLKFEDLIEPIKDTGFRIVNNIILSYCSEKFFLSLKEPDNYCSLSPYSPIQITNFRQDENGNKFVIGKKLKNIENFFTEPLPSISSLGISIADICPNEDEEIFKIENINCKLMRLPFNNKSVLIPILHDCT